METPPALHEGLAGVLIRYDMRLKRRERVPNMSRIALLLEALDRAEQFPALKSGIDNEFSDPRLIQDLTRELFK